MTRLSKRARGDVKGGRSRNGPDRFSGLASCDWGLLPVQLFDDFLIGASYADLICFRAEIHDEGGGIIAVGIGVDNMFRIQGNSFSRHLFKIDKHDVLS